MQIRHRTLTLPVVAFSLREEANLHLHVVLHGSRVQRLIQRCGCGEDNAVGYHMAIDDPSVDQIGAVDGFEALLNWDEERVKSGRLEEYVSLLHVHAGTERAQPEVANLHVLRVGQELVCIWVRRLHVQ